MNEFTKKRRLLFCWVAIILGLAFIAGAYTAHSNAQPPKGYISTTGTVIATIPSNNPKCFVGAWHGEISCTSVIQFTTSSGQKKTFTEGVAFGDGTTLSVAYDSSNPSVAETLGSAKIATALAIVGIILLLGGIVYMVVLRKTKVVQ